MVKPFPLIDEKFTSNGAATYLTPYRDRRDETSIQQGRGGYGASDVVFLDRPTAEWLHTQLGKLLELPSED